MVTVNGALDYETATSHNITARATSSDGSITTQGFTINVTDVNEVGRIGHQRHRCGGRLRAGKRHQSARWWASPPSPTDPDGTDTVSYSLDDDAGGLFAIDATTGVVTVAGAIDREAASCLQHHGPGHSTDTSSTTQVFNIAIGDVDEFDIGAVSDSDAAANTVAENATVGTAVGITATASDADATNNTITYTLDDDAGGLFAIDANTGVVTVNGGTGLRDGHQPQHHGPGHQQRRQLHHAELYDQRHRRQRSRAYRPSATPTRPPTSCWRTATVGTVVGVTAFADDPDGTDTVSYSLDDDAGGLFAIDATTGVVTVAGAIDREAASCLQHHGPGHLDRCQQHHPSLQHRHRRRG